MTLNLFEAFPDAWKALWSDTSKLQEMFLKIEDQLKKEQDKYQGLEIYPPQDDIFRCFQYFPPSGIKVVIIGQDCYHGQGQATGLCFGVHNGVKVPPSLRNIIKECRNQINQEKKDTIPPEATLDTSLEHWAKQGVLLLNCALTVRQACPGSHLLIWKPFIQDLIQKIAESQHHLVFLLWGTFAKNKTKFLHQTTHTHHLLSCNHPSPLSANRGGWFGNNHFIEANQLLQKHHRVDIQWWN